MLNNPLIDSPRTTLLGLVPGGMLIEDGIREVAQAPDNWAAWVRLVFGLFSIIAGALMRDAKPLAPATVTRNRSS